MSPKRKAPEVYCDDCGVDVLGIIAPVREWYMVHDLVWEAARMPYEGYLCVGCLEGRLGRQLNADDFTDYPVNWPDFYQNTSERLKDRLLT